MPDQPYESVYPLEEISSEGVPNYLVATPYYGGADLEHIHCYETLKKLYPSVKCYRVNGCAYIDIARATIAAMVLERGHDGLFFIDHDIIFDPRELVGMIRAAHREQAIVYSIYSMRTSGRRAIGGLPHDVKQIVCGQGGGLYPGEYGGLGFCAIPRSAIETIGAGMPELETGWSKVRALFALRSGFPDWPELYAALVKRGMLASVHGWIPADRGHDVESARAAETARATEFAAIAAQCAGREYEGEDTSFFFRARRAGVRLLCDTRPRIFHKGSYKYGLEDVQLVVPRGRSLTIDYQPSEDGRQKIEAVGAGQFEQLEDTRQ